MPYGTSLHRVQTIFVATSSCVQEPRTDCLRLPPRPGRVVLCIRSGCMYFGPQNQLGGSSNWGVLQPHGLHAGTDHDVPQGFAAKDPPALSDATADWQSPRFSQPDSVSLRGEKRLGCTPSTDTVSLGASGRRTKRLTVAHPRQCSYQTLLRLGEAVSEQPPGSGGRWGVVADPRLRTATRPRRSSCQGGAPGYDETTSRSRPHRCDELPSGLCTRDGTQCRCGGDWD